MLARMHSYTGVVQGGGKQAARLGFPTANIPLPDMSVSGIFAARADVAGTSYEAVAYADPKRGLLEVHLLGFEGNVYGERLSADLLHKVREDQVFRSEDEARERIAEDIAAVRDYFAA